MLKTEHINAQRIPSLGVFGLRLAYVMFLSSILSLAQAQTARSSLTLSKQQLTASQINADEIQSALFVHFKEQHSAMLVENSQPGPSIKLRAVQFFGGTRHSVWLRSNCKGKSGALQLEECKGSVCTPLVPRSGKNEHGRDFNGEFAIYSMAGAQLGKHLVGKTQLTPETCNNVWPTWAVTARSFQRNTELSVPTHLVLLQTQNTLVWYDALNRQVWNKTPWDANRSGYFTAAESSDDGRILLKNAQGLALYFDFAKNRAFALLGNSVLSANFGLSGIFAAGAWPATGLEIHFQSGLSAQRVDVNLGGVWWAQQYLSWDNIAVSLARNTSPETAVYPNQETILSASWSEASGIGKTALVFAGDNRAKIFSQEWPQSKFHFVTNISTQHAQEMLKTAKLIHSEGNLSAVDREGTLFILESNFERIRASVGSKGSFVQLGGELFLSQPLSPGRCLVLHLRSRTGEAGWLAGLPLGETDCAVGASRSSNATGLVEKVNGGLRVHFLTD